VITLSDAHETPETIGEVWRIAFVGLTIYAGLVLLPFAGRGVRGFVYRIRRPPQLTHSNGRTMAMLPGATVLETLRANGIPQGAEGHRGGQKPTRTTDKDDGTTFMASTQVE
jgi:hypothetical protein